MFKYKCFIRKNNSFLRDTLEKLGYCKHLPVDNDILVSTNNGKDESFFTSITDVNQLDSLFIDCGENETLFLAISAITDEHDKFQFFTTLTEVHWVNQETYIPKGSPEFCMVTDRYLGRNPLFVSSPAPARKANIDELFAFFKGQKEDHHYYSQIPEERWKKTELDFEKYALTEEEKEVLEAIDNKENVEVEKNLKEIKESIYNSDLKNTKELINNLNINEIIELINSITEDRDFYKNKVNDLLKKKK